MCNLLSVLFEVCFGRGVRTLFQADGAVEGSWDVLGTWGNGTWEDRTPGAQTLGGRWANPDAGQMELRLRGGSSDLPKPTPFRLD